jgi:hypothetical protein
MGSCHGAGTVVVTEIEIEVLLAEELVLDGSAVA